MHVSRVNLLELATLHGIGPKMADFATFIRDSVISVTDECDVTEVTQ